MKNVRFVPTFSKLRHIMRQENLDGKHESSNICVVSSITYCVQQINHLNIILLIMQPIVSTTFISMY